ncbi:hypothetical protein ACJX0J_017407, partial [Zea mays]
LINCGLISSKALKAQKDIWNMHYLLKLENKLDENVEELHQAKEEHFSVAMQCSNNVDEWRIGMFMIKFISPFFVSV